MFLDMTTNRSSGRSTRAFLPVGSCETAGEPVDGPSCLSPIFHGDRAIMLFATGDLTATL